jgi:hypothetical protein
MIIEAFAANPAKIANSIELFPIAKKQTEKLGIERNSNTEAVLNFLEYSRIAKIVANVTPSVRNGRESIGKGRKNKVIARAVPKRKILEDFLISVFNLSCSKLKMKASNTGSGAQSKMFLDITELFIPIIARL